MVSLGKAFNMSSHHRSAIGLKVNLLVEHFAPSRYLNSDDFERFALDFLQMGNGYLEQVDRSEEHTSELQSLMRISYAVFCLKKKTKHRHQNNATQHIQNKDMTKDIH